MRWQAAGFLAGLLLAALIISSSSGDGPILRERWSLTAVRLDTVGSSDAAGSARAGADTPARAQERQRVELDLVFVVEDSPARQDQAPGALQLVEGAPVGHALQDAPPGDAQHPPVRQQRCAVYNGVPFHADVAAGMAWAFQEAGCNVATYLHPDMHGMRRVMEPWFRGTHRDRKQLVEDAAQYDVIVMVTFPEHSFATQLSLLLGQHRPPAHQRLLLVTHNPDKVLVSCSVSVHEWLLNLLAERAVRWGPVTGGGSNATAPAEGQAAAGAAAVLSPRIQLLTLAPCVSNFTAAMLESWAAARHSGSSSSSKQPQADVPWLAPLMPWATQPTRQGDALRPAHLCIQGSINPKRRDYASAFAAASHPAVLAQLRARNESLLLVGSYRGAQLGVPAELAPHVRILSDLSFQDYYATLSRCRVILTAFVSDVYIVKKASSTLAAALQVGTPLLTEDSVLTGYSYLSTAAAFSYRRPAASGPTPDPAALGAEAGRQAASLPKAEWHSLRVRCKRAAAAAGRRHLQEAAQASGGEKLAASGGTADGSAAGGRDSGMLPAPGSYAAALLASFDDSANQAAHAAAWRLKEQVMQHNVQVARQVLAA